MPCKHEGGTDPCQRYRDRSCKVWRDIQANSWSKNNRKRKQELQKLYAENMCWGTQLKGRDSGKSAAACELLVRADLSKRGFEVTVPVSPTAKHDLHVELPSVGWRGVQVRSGKLNRKTNHLRPACNKPCLSPIYAIVYLPTNRIEYRDGTEILPPELQE